MKASKTLSLVGALALAGCGAELEKVEDMLAILQGSGTSGRTLGGGPGGEDPGADLTGSGALSLRGSLVSQSGSQAAMQGWAVVMLDRERTSARVGEVDAAGLYALEHVASTTGKTVALLSPDYIAQSVLSMPSGQPATIRQFVRPQSTTLPRLVARGRVVTFEHYAGIEVLRDLASDADGDGVPDGAITMELVQSSAVDLDLDGTPNARDPDIDGDGLHNALDPDDNGNGILDIFDGDANGDLVNDAEQELSDHHFTEGAFVVTTRYLPARDASGAAVTRLDFAVWVSASTPRPAAVQIRGAPSLLNGAVSEARDASGQPVLVAWNRLLRDDGAGCDQVAGDALYCASVELEAGKAPRAHEMLFAQLVYGTAERPWFKELPHSFAPIAPGPTTLQFDPATRTTLLAGNPYGAIQDFAWVLEVFEDARLVYASQAIPGAVRQWQVPQNVFRAGRRYELQVTAQSIAPVLGRPWTTVTSPRYAITP